MKPALAIFAKKPVAGKVKTRLAKHCGNKIAAEIASVLLTETVKLCAQVWPGPRILYCWPDTDHDLFRFLSDTYDLQLAGQCPGSLGDKMFDALLTESKRYGCAAVIGADIPHCPKHVLGQAYDWLLQDRSVIGPASDGGYYFIGMDIPEKKLFERISWGSKSVFGETINRASEIGLSFSKLETLQDIDEWHDLVDVSRQVPGLEKFVV